MVKSSSAASVQAQVEDVWLDSSSVSFDPDAWLANRLSEEERQDFVADGYLQIASALPAKVFEELTAAITSLRADKLAEGRDEDEIIRQSGFSAANRLQETDVLAHLLSSNHAFPRAVDILGCNVFTNYCTVEFAPGSSSARVEAPLEQDLDRANVDMSMDIPGQPRPRLSLKLIFSLTQTEVSVVAGSQEHDELPTELAPTIVALEPNSCLLLDRRTWHARQPVNQNGESQLTVTIGLAQRWMKARDAMFVEPIFGRLRCPVLRQLLGWTSSHQGHFGGSGLDVPLRQWLHDHGIDDDHLGLGRIDRGGGLGNRVTANNEGDVAHATFPRHPERIRLPLGPRPPSPLSPPVAEIYKSLGLEHCRLDPAEYMMHRLTDAERKQFAETGFLCIHNALPPEQHAALSQELEEMRARQVAQGTVRTTGVSAAAAFSQDNDAKLQANDAIPWLLTNPRVFPKVVDLLGFNIYTYHLHVNVTPAAEPGTRQPSLDELMTSVPTFGFHQDSGMQRSFEERPAPGFSLKCGYFLTDTSSAGMANTWIVPRRHMDATLETPAGRVGQPKDAIPFAAPANSCCIFDRRLWHSATPNWSQVTRKVLFLGYAYRWTQSKDPMFVERALASERCPVTRQMMGVTTSNAGASCLCMSCCDVKLGCCVLLCAASAFAADT